MTRKRNAITGEDKLRTVIEEYPQLLGVLSRFGMSFGFGDLTVSEACKEDGVDTPSLLAVCNFLCDLPYTGFEISLPSLMGYLRKAHSHFLDYLLPAIRHKLIEAINCNDVNDIAFLLLKFYDDYVQEVRNHMQNENDQVYTYVSNLLEGKIQDNFRITFYSINHGSMAEKLDELKDIFIRHYHVRGNEILTSALMDIIYCGRELTNHCNIENTLFVPAVEKLERKLQLATSVNADSESNQSADHRLVDLMTDREKEVIRCVAKGMSNKEIASHLYLSIHTVTTYRRNISAKLDIHSAAGLTIFAILHNIIDIKEVSTNI